MVRLPLGLVAGLVLAGALASPARGAEVTDVATAAEPGNPFDLRFSIRWDRLQERGLITRERAVDASEAPPVGAIVDATELRYRRVRNELVTRVAVGLYQDLQLTVDVPYVLNDDGTWRYGLENGLPVGPNGPTSLGGSNDPNVDAMNRACAGACPLFPVGGGVTIYHGGRVGDVRVGLAWAAFNQRKDDTKPTWVVGLDTTLPTASRWVPVAGRGADWLSPNADSADPGTFGEKVWKWDFWTALSRRMGPFDPYFKAHLTVMRESNDTWSNCLGAETFATARPGVPEMTNAGVENCADRGWEDEAGAKLPYVAGLLFGAEIIPRENRRASQKLSIDVRLWADYTSRQRFYNELTDASGKLHWTEPYYTMGGLLGFYLQASRNVSLHASASLAAMTPHFLTGESLGRDGVEDGDVTGETSNPDLNPNFDWRYDVPGRRFRLSDTNLFTLSVGGVLRF